MKILRDLCREVWRVWSRSDLARDPTRQIIELLQSGNTQQALAAIRASDATTIHWEQISHQLKSAGRPAGSLLYLALRHTTDRVAVLLDLGHWLAGNGEPLRAFLCAEAAHHLTPAEPAPLILMGWIQLSLGNPQSAGNHFLAALRRDEGHREAWQGYRTALQYTRGVLPPPADKPDDTDVRLLAAIDNHPDDHLTHLALGKHYATTSRCTLALPHLRAACELAKHAREPAFWLAWSMVRLSDYGAALGISRQALEHAPDDIGLIKLAADCAIRCREDARALQWLLPMLTRSPEDADLHAMLGLCYNHLERFEEAAVSLNRALELNPALGEARHTLAFSLYCLGHYEESREHLDTLLASERNDFSARWYRSGTLLACHTFETAWPDYEFRFVAAAVETRIIPLPTWQGEDLSGKKIVVVAEQGIGDEIMFASTIPELLRQAATCVIECNRRLVPLFQRSFPWATVVEWVKDPLPPWLAQHGDADYHIFCGSLPKHFRCSIASYQKFQPYLVVNTDRAAALRQRIDLSGPGLKVGIAWRGGGNASRTKTRSLTLAQLRPLLGRTDCRFVSLQYGDCSDEVADFSATTGLSVTHWPELIANLDDFACLVAALDVVVTVCSAPVHFAGAQGKPALVLTPFAPEWRYHSINGRMIWYPSVRLLPQEQLDDWDSTIEKVAGMLSTYM